MPLPIRDAAILHVLNQIRRRAEVRYYLGAFTESFELLIEAAIEITGKPREELEGFYLCPLAESPRWPDRKDDE